MAIKFVDRVPTRPGRIKITPEDGSNPWYGVMERADEPSVEGTPINATNLNAMQQNQGMSGNMTVYVSTSGSDSLGDGTNAAPYATITKALSVIPKVLNGHTAIISVASGIYNEEVRVARFSGGNLVITGVAGANVSINYLLVDNCTVLVESIILTILKHSENNAMYIRGGKIYFLGDLVINTTGARGIYANRNSFVLVNGTLTINSSNASGIYAIAIVQYSGLFASTVAGGINVSTGMLAGEGGQITFGTNNMTAKTAFITSNGGRIYSGAQTSIPNY